MAAAGLLSSGFVKTNEQQWILIIFYLCLHMDTLKVAEGKASIGWKTVWSMKNREIWIAAILANKDEVFPQTGEWMSLRYKLTKGHNKKPE